MDPADFVDGRKRVALALVGLTAADRRWLLAQLPDAERDGVVVQLGELDRMELPFAAHEISAALDAPVVPAARRVEPELPPDADALRMLDSAPAAVVHRALRDEPDVVIARIGALRDWHWNTELSARLGPTRARAVAQLRRDTAAAPAAVSQALLAALASRVARERHGGFAAELDAAAVPSAAPLKGGRRWPWVRK